MTEVASRTGGRITFADAARELLRHDASPPTTPPRNLHRLILGNGKRTAQLLAAAEAGQTVATIQGQGRLRPRPR